MPFYKLIISDRLKLFEFIGLSIFASSLQQFNDAENHQFPAILIFGQFYCCPFLILLMCDIIDFFFFC